LAKKCGRKEREGVCNDADYVERVEEREGKRKM
jgi:hypothetical protein